MLGMSAKRLIIAGGSGFLGHTVNCRYNAQNMLDIYTSRLDSTRALGRAIASLGAPPPVWLNSFTTVVRLGGAGPRRAAGSTCPGFTSWISAAPWTFCFSMT